MNNKSSKDVLNPAGPPFTVGRYGSLGACVTAERNCLRAVLKEILEELQLDDSRHDLQAKILLATRQPDETTP